MKGISRIDILQIFKLTLKFLKLQPTYSTLRGLQHNLLIPFSSIIADPCVFLMNILFITVEDFCQ